MANDDQDAEYTRGYRAGLLVAYLAAGGEVDVTNAPVVWERCTGCGEEFRYPYLCRTHMLCGTCHEGVGVGE